jgi:acyl CoA:acetate/3-ketoacid CoA transferase alpha subunit
MSFDVCQFLFQAGSINIPGFLVPFLVGADQVKPGLVFILYKQLLLIVPL